MPENLIYQDLAPGCRVTALKYRQGGKNKGWRAARWNPTSGQLSFDAFCQDWSRHGAASSQRLERQGVCSIHLQTWRPRSRWGDRPFWNSQFRIVGHLHLYSRLSKASFQASVATANHETEDPSIEKQVLCAGLLIDSCILSVRFLYCRMGYCLKCRIAGIVIGIGWWVIASHALFSSVFMFIRLLPMEVFHCGGIKFHIIKGKRRLYLEVENTRSACRVEMTGP